MSTTEKTAVTVATTVNAPMEKVWNFFTDPKHIINWYNASDDWHAPYADNDLRMGGKFKTTMASRDGKMSFDFEGTYTKVEHHKAIDYVLADDRKIYITFSGNGNQTTVTETFDTETENTVELQRTGWQNILDNFKKYTEAN